MLLSQATKIQLGSLGALKVYLGSTSVWALTVPPVEGGDYTTWAGPGWFDASDPAFVAKNASNHVNSVSNKRLTGGDLSIGGTQSNMFVVADAQNGLQAIRVIASPNYNPSRLVASPTAPISTMFQGEDKPWTVIMAFKPTDTGTGHMWAAATTLGSTAEHQAITHMRRNATPPSIRAQSTTATVVDRPFGVSQPANTARVVAFRSNGTAVTVWDNNTSIKLLDNVGLDVGAMRDDVAFMMFTSRARASDGVVNWTNYQASFDFYEMVVDDTARTDAEIGAAMAAIGAKWGISIAGAPAITATLPNQATAVGASNTTVNLDSYFSGATSYSISPTGADVSISGSTMTITTTAPRDAPYTVTATNANGNTTQTFALFISAASIPAYSLVKTFTTTDDLADLVTRASLDDFSDRPVNNATTTINNGRLRVTASTNAKWPDTAIPLTGLMVGRTYTFTIDHPARTGGTTNISVRNGLSSATADATIIWPASGGGPYGLDIALGTHTGSFVATQEVHYFYLGNGAGSNGQYAEWDNFSLTAPAEGGAVAPTVTTPLPDRVMTQGDTALTANLNSHFANATSYTVSPTGQGVTISGNTMTIASTTVRNTNYTITATGGGQTVTDVFNVVVNAVGGAGSGSLAVPAGEQKSYATGTTSPVTSIT